jgi:hypothetical protein
MVWGSFEVRFSDGYSALPHQAIIVAWGGWGFCDAGHQAVVMKKCGAAQLRREHLRPPTHCKVRDVRGTRRNRALSTSHSGNRNKIKLFDTVGANRNKIRQELSLPPNESLPFPFGVGSHSLSSPIPKSCPISCDSLVEIVLSILISSDNISDSYTAARSGSLSAERASLGNGMLTITEVPEPFDSIFISPWN